MYQIKEINDLDLLKKILTKYKFNPYKHYYFNDFNPFDYKFLNFFQERNKKCFCIKKNGKIVGLTIFSKLEWDSEILKFNAGKIDFIAADGDYNNKFKIKNILTKGIIKKCLEEGINYILCRINSNELSSINSLISNRFILIDGILKFSLNLKNLKLKSINQNIETRLVDPEEIDQIKKIARGSFKIDRFHSDPLIPNDQADRLYEIWAENSCKNKVADAVIVGSIDGQIISFVTCKIDKIAKEYFNLHLGVIELVATKDKFRKKRFAKYTTYGAIEWFKNNKIEIVEVGTQISNIAASRLYESCGFKLISTSLTFRKALKRKAK